MEQIFVGKFLHSKSLKDLEIIADGFIAVRNGKIIDVGTYSAEISSKYEKFERTTLTDKQFIIPGFVDCHIHAPQMPNIGLGLETGLLDWLQLYTFPLEARYKDLDFAEDVFRKVVSRTLCVGTTCACYFATNHKESSEVLATEAIRQGQRAFVGKVSANCLCPDYYVETSKSSIDDNIEFIETVLSKKSSLVRPIITPRFALSCDEELMTELGKIAKKYDLNIQSHISESIGEIQAIKEKFPNHQNYASVYDSAGLLTDKCVMAHAVHLTDDEISLFKKRGTSVAHCANSNLCLKSGLCDVRRLLNGGVKVGLGTDVAGGSEVSILKAIRTTINVSQTIEFIKKQVIMGSGHLSNSRNTEEEYSPICLIEAFYLATLGGAEALCLGEKIGNFVVGKEFDALLIDVGKSPIDIYDMTMGENPKSEVMKLFQKFLYIGDDRNITKVFVNGKQVKKYEANLKNKLNL